MMKNDTLLQMLGETITTLQVSEANQVVTSSKQLLEQVKQREEKGLALTQITKCSNK